MALPTATEAKRLLRIEDTSEDTLVDELLTRAKALIEAFLGYPLTATSQAVTDYSRLDEWDTPTVLQLPGPVAAVPAPTVVDVDSVTFDSTTYYVDRYHGKIRAKRGYSFQNGPYTVTATIGLSSHPDYAARLEAVASQAILELVSHLYLNRNPAATTESDEGGGSKSIATQTATQGAMPLRVLEWVQQLPLSNGYPIA